MDFRIGLRMGVGDYWDSARYLVGVWDGLNVVGLWVDVQGELCYRDVLVYGLVEYMDYYQV